MKIANMKSSLDFSIEIEKMVKEKKMDYFDAVIMYCEKNNIEIETAGSLVKQNSALKAKIQMEAENVNLVRKSGARLPL